MRDFNQWLLIKSHNKNLLYSTHIAETLKLLLFSFEIAKVSFSDKTNAGSYSFNNFLNDVDYFWLIKNKKMYDLEVKLLPSKVSKSSLIIQVKPKTENT